MPSTAGVNYLSNQMLESPRSPLNCQVLSLHLPLSGPQPRPSAHSLSSSIPSFSRSQGSHLHSKSSSSYGQLSSPPPLPIRSIGRSPPHHHTKTTISGSYGSDNSRRPGPPLRLCSRGASPQDQASNGYHSVQEVPTSMLLPIGSPGTARRAKAHVASACVNCKRKHLACETRRPCNRCLQAGKEATCVDVQHKKRGRPRLRDEEQGHGVTYGGESSHAHLYPAQPEVFDLQGSNSRAHTRTMSYREIRSRPGSVYGGASQTAFVDPSNPGYTSYQDALPSSYNIPETNPTALLTLEFVVLRSNYAFEEALSLGSTLQGRPLSDLLVASDRDKLQRLQNSLRAELQSKVHIPPIRSTAPGVALDIFSVTAGFQQRPEYWTFCLRNGQSHGFPISVSLAKTTTYFVILTLVATAKPSMSAISPTSHPSTYSALSSLGSVPLQTASQYQAGPPVSSHGPGLSSCRRQSSSSQSTMGYSPPTSSIIASTPRTSLHGTEATRDNLRHLQLPPIRTTGIGEGGSRRDIDRGRGSSAKESPQSAKRMKRRRVEIGEICGK